MNMGPVEEAASHRGGIDLKFLPIVRILDVQLAGLSRLEQIQAITKIVTMEGMLDGTFEINLDIAKVLLEALEVLFEEDGLGVALSGEEGVVFRSHLMYMYDQGRANLWGRYLSGVLDNRFTNLRLALLEKILKGWKWDYDCSTSPATKVYPRDAEKCFMFVCNEYETVRKHLDFHLSNKIKDVFRSHTGGDVWQAAELTPWIPRAPNDLASVLLIQRARASDIEDLKREIEFLKDFNPAYRSFAAREFAISYFPRIVWIDNVAQHLVEVVKTAISATKSPKKDLVKVEIASLSYKAVNIKVVLPVTKSIEPKPYQDITSVAEEALKNFRISFKDWKEVENYPPASKFIEKLNLNISYVQEH